MHSTNSDGSNLTSDMVKRYYNLGFDVLAMTDHNYLTTSWDNVARGALSAADKAAIENGTFAGSGERVQTNGMIGFDNTNEQSHTDHINTFWAPFNNTTANLNDTLNKALELGGISRLNHPGRYTGGVAGGTTGTNASNNAAHIAKYVNIFNTYPNCVGMEIINKLDNESRSDRILWDNILKQTMPEGRGVWGFSDDDSHSTSAAGYSFNIMLMPELTQAAVRTAMETGAFYAVSRVDRREGINASAPAAGDGSTLYLLSQPTPYITDITVAGSVITVTGEDYIEIEWIADGEKIATGATININDYADVVDSYVRAQLKSSTGIAFLQPFGVTFKEADPEAEAVIDQIDRLPESITLSDKEAVTDAREAYDALTEQQQAFVTNIGALEAAEAAIAALETETSDAVISQPEITSAINSETTSNINSTTETESKQTTTSAADDNNQSPKTGDQINLYIGVAFISLLVAAVVLKRKNCIDL